MKDIVNSFKAHMYERTSSPLLGAFIFYWIIFNYKFFIVIFDDKLNSENKFEQIERLYANDFLSIGIMNIPIYGFLLPVLITLVYILVFPFISNFIHKAWVWHQNKLKEISNGKVLTKKEFGELQQKFTELELSFDDKFQKKDTEILKLKSSIEKKDTLIFEYQSKIDSFEKIIHSKDEKINKLENDINNYNIELNKKKEEIVNLKKTIDRLKPNIDGFEEKIIKLYVNDFKKIIPIENIIEELNLKEIEANYGLDNLLNKSLIESTIIPNIYPNKYGYKLSKKGERFLVEKKYV